MVNHTVRLAGLKFAQAKGGPQGRTLRAEAVAKLVYISNDTHHSIEDVRSLQEGLDRNNNVMPLLVTLERHDFFMHCCYVRFHVSFLLKLDSTMFTLVILEFIQVHGKKTHIFLRRLISTSLPS